MKALLCVSIIYTYFRNRQIGEKLFTVSFWKFKSLGELTDAGLLTESLQAFRHACLLPYNAKVRGDVSTSERRKSQSPT